MSTSDTLPRPDQTVVETLAEQLSVPELASIIDLIAYPVVVDGRPAVVVRNAGGIVRLSLIENGTEGVAERHEVLAGRDPVQNTDRSPSCRTASSRPIPVRTTSATPIRNRPGGCSRSSPTLTEARTWF